MGSGLFLGFSRQPRHVQHGLDQWDQTVHRGPTGGTVIDIRPSVRNKSTLARIVLFTRATKLPALD